MATVEQIGRRLWLPVFFVVLIVTLVAMRGPTTINFYFGSP